MCGIFAYVGKNNSAAEDVLAGLKLLEYRGYDSWGIAVKQGKKLLFEKHVGKIGNAKTILPKSSLGIGHTRWATHGGVTVANSHPHLDCQKELALVHNGIIENYQELKKKLLKKGHIFLSETDTEVAVHLIEDHLKTKGFATAVRDAFSEIKGFNAFVIAHSASNEIIAVKSGSPIVAGIGKKGLYVSSDVSGIVKHTRQVVFLEDNQMIILGETLTLIQLPSGKKITPTIQTIDWKFEDTTRGKYKHFVDKEIHEQPRVIANLATNSHSEVQKFAQLIKKAYGTFFLGCGSAGYAGLAGTYLFSQIAKKHVNFSVGSEFSYLEDYITPQTVIIPISQSGETIDVVDPVAKAKKKGATIASIVNVVGSTLYRQSDYHLLLQAGPEKAVIGTKSFTSMIAVLLLIAYALAKKQSDGEALLQRTAKNITKLFSSTEEIMKVAKKIKNTNDVYIIGRGLSYAASLEMALKLKETAYVHAEGFAGGELKHGVIALIEKGTPCIVVAPNDETYWEIISNAQEVKARGGYIVGIGPRNNAVFDSFLKTADAKEATIIEQVIISQILAYNVALLKGLQDPDKPRNLAKSVVVK